jgi:hypothetical protein
VRPLKPMLARVVVSPATKGRTTSENRRSQP